MTAILFVKSSPRGSASVSGRLGEALLARLRHLYPDAKVSTRDLLSEPPEHLGPDYVAGRYLPPTDRTADQAAAVAQPDRMIAELKAADIIVIASAMINFSISAQLKAWIDQIVRTNATFAFQDGRPVGLVTGKKAYVIEARGGVYDAPPLNEIDFQRPYLKAILAFIGITDVTFISAQGQSLGDDFASQAAADAEATIEAIAA